MIITIIIIIIMTTMIIIKMLFLSFDERKNENDYITLQQLLTYTLNDLYIICHLIAIVNIR